MLGGSQEFALCAALLTIARHLNGYQDPTHDCPPGLWDYHKERGLQSLSSEASWLDVFKELEKRPICTYTATPGPNAFQLKRAELSSCHRSLPLQPSMQTISRGFVVATGNS